MGGLWGSFANVCIYRLPEQKSVVSGRSFCPNCKKKIVWYDNIPIISYFLLGARCRNCKKKISIKYLIVELINTISFITIYYIFGISLTTIFLMSLSLSFLIIFFIDLKHFIIPNELTFTMMFVGFFKSFDPNLHFLFPNYLDSLIGGLFGYGVIWSIIIFYKQIRKKPTQKDPNILDLEKELSDKIGLKTSIHFNENGSSGSLTLFYSDLNQLDDVMKRLKK